MKKLLIILAFVSFTAKGADFVPGMMSIGAGGNFVAGGGAFCINGGVAFAPTRYPSVYLGADLSLSFFTSPLIEIIPTVFYRFNLRNKPNLKPYIGFGLGPAFNFAGAFNLEVAMRLGLEFVMRSTWGIRTEIQGGSVFGSFFFKPLVNVLYYF